MDRDEINEDLGTAWTGSPAGDARRMDRAAAAAQQAAEGDSEGDAFLAELWEEYKSGKGVGPIAMGYLRAAGLVP